MMEEIFNWVMLGWLLNVGMFIFLVLVISVKVLTKEDPTIFKINSEIYIQRVKPISKLQKWASWLIPFYGALMSVIFAGYFIKNYNRDTIIVLLEVDYILENYRIWKRGGIAN